MFEALLRRLKPDNETENESKRRYNRRECDRCVVVVGENMYPVENWSMGGLLIYGDTKRFAVDHESRFTMKFKLRNKMLDINHGAKVVRKAGNYIAMEFLPLTQQVQNQFQTVIDDYMAGEFAKSQTRQTA